tara:strand:+ start:4495 stop:5643 length:1149 start_codon:yes stop_codon:yes gene_type:complete
MLTISEKVIIILISFSSQIFPENNFVFIPYLSIISLIILLIYYVKFKKYTFPSYFLVVLWFVFLSLIFQYQDLNAFLRQFSRLLYPWILLSLYNLLLLKDNYDRDKIFEILKFTSLSIYIILIPDFISSIYTFITNTNNLIILKFASVAYRETNTTAFLLLYAMIFRIENRLSNYKEIFIATTALILTFSRSSILLFLVYSIYKLLNSFVPEFKFINFKLWFSRLFPISILIFLFLIYRFLNIDSLATNGYSFSVNDSSFLTRVLIFDYLKFYISSIDSNELMNFLLGYGWSGYQKVLSEIPFNYEGTTGHTILGILPEYGLIYTSFLFSFFYVRAFRGFISDSFLLGLSILAFFPFPYIAPILSLIHTNRKLKFLIKKDSL